MNDLARGWEITIGYAYICLVLTSPHLPAMKQNFHIVLAVCGAPKAHLIGKGTTLPNCFLAGLCHLKLLPGSMWVYDMSPPETETSGYLFKSFPNSYSFLLSGWVPLLPFRPLWLYNCAIAFRLLFSLWWWSTWAAIGRSSWSWLQIWHPDACDLGITATAQICLPQI